MYVVGVLGMKILMVNKVLALKVSMHGRNNCYKEKRKKKVPGIKVSIIQVPGMNGSLLEVCDVTVFVVVSGMTVFVVELDMTVFVVEVPGVTVFVVVPGMTVFVVGPGMAMFVVEVPGLKVSIIEIPDMNGSLLEVCDRTDDSVCGCIRYGSFRG